MLESWRKYIALKKNIYTCTNWKLDGRTRNHYRWCNSTCSI